jgi:hypothetical protein
MAAPIASGWSESCRVGLSPTGKTPPYGDLEKSHPWDFSTRDAKIAISATLDFQALRRFKMAEHSRPTRAPCIFQGALITAHATSGHELHAHFSPPAQIINYLYSKTLNRRFRLILHGLCAFLTYSSVFLVYKSNQQRLLRWISVSN